MLGGWAGATAVGRWVFLAAVVSMTLPGVFGAEDSPRTLQFAGYSWAVRTGHGGPGPNTWEGGNVSVDGEGRLHLRIRLQEGRWSCAEVTLQQRLGFGRYEFEVEGPIDRLDDNVVLGLFNYPTRDVGGDATHEIDIEFARWGASKNPIGNYTVWPVEKGLKPTSKVYNFRLDGLGSTHRFDWSSARVLYRSWQGVQPGGTEIAEWTFEPVDPERRISRKPMPLHFNLWLFQGRPPKDGREVEVVIRGFRFVPG